MDKINAVEKEDELDIVLLMKEIFKKKFNNGCKFMFSDEALALLAEYHDNEVISEKKQDLFED